MNVPILILLIGLLGSKEHKKPKGPPESTPSKTAANSTTGPIKALSLCSRRRFSSHAPPSAQFSNVTPKCDHLSIEICDSVGSSKHQWRGWSHAAACVPSEASDIRWKRGQRVPKHERRAMVSIRGCWKTPCNKTYQKEVGGSYYVIREIIQELEYKSKMKPVNNIGEIPVAKLFDESKLKTAESVSVSPGDIKTAREGPIQGRVQPVRVHVTLAPEFLEGKGGPQFSSWEARLCNEFEIISAPDDHCTTSAGCYGKN
ncbi:hypothetical protein KIW84_051912 [Lathyrus oleraceus]|uniref:AT3G52170-like helix-turn-helix domain-containing protein n=1 Tax=Pisum sativum TaxID=3888 RepID=A0A9D5ABA1_PEA|nr:hypothetical protein KIW84_051912 [Pisum sativum]